MPALDCIPTSGVFHEILEKSRGTRLRAVCRWRPQPGVSAGPSAPRARPDLSQVGRRGYLHIPADRVARAMLMAFELSKRVLDCAHELHAGFAERIVHGFAVLVHGHRRVAVQPRLEHAAMVDA